MSQLIIAEKPKAAGRIAYALAEDEPEKKKKGKAIWYEIDDSNEKIYIVPAVGHLFNLKQKGKGWTYPTFDMEWKPAFEVKDNLGWMKQYYKNLENISKKADKFINACDYDQEGAVIGYNIIKHIVGTENAGRMKFSTLTTSDLQEAYENVDEKLDMGMVNSGLARHILDWLWGINLSRALTISIKKGSNNFKVLSTGRVQGPALKILADKEREIQKFEPEDYWLLQAIIKHENGDIEAWHQEGRFWQKDEAEDIKSKCEKNDGKVEDVEKNRYKHNPPVPFDLSTLQTEAYSAFRFKPSKTLNVAQSLYESGYISYPRTSSQKLPPKIGYKKILKKLKNQNKYEKLSQLVLNKKKIYPRQGKKKDPAHPAIYPTGTKPKKLNQDEKKLYDLIVKRYLAVFGEPAIRKSLKLYFNLSDEIFTAKGKKTVEENWFKLYKPYLNIKETEMPEIKKGKNVSVSKICLLEKQTKPPNRYTQASLVKKLQKKNLGTKATRSQIIDTLYHRGYVDGTSIKVTDLGLTVVETLENYSAEVLSTELTRKFEEKMEEIRNSKSDKKKVIEEAKSTLKKILEEIKKHEQEIGKSLGEAVRETRKKKRELGECPKCGGTLKIIKTKKSQFVGCSGYPDCENSYPLPQRAKIVNTQKSCKECGLPVIKVIRKGKRPFTMCIDPDCKSKEDW